MNHSLLLGYWIAARNVDSGRLVTLEYRGLDRLSNLDLPSPLEQEQLVAAGRRTLVDLASRYYDAEDSQALNTDRDLALQLRDEMRSEGLDVEVIFAEVLDVPPLPPQDQDLYDLAVTRFQNRRAIHDQLAQTEYEADLCCLGVDVTYAHPTFHSAILHGNLDTVMLGYEEHLNQYGLFPDYDPIADVVRELNLKSDYSLRPFCPVRISAVI